MADRWINFSDRMPSRSDADERGYVELLETNGSSREGMWDWVRSEAHWYANGFAAWRRIPASAQSEGHKR
jgi:hypothetical protein